MHVKKFNNTCHYGTFCNWPGCIPHRARTEVTPRALKCRVPLYPAFCRCAAVKEGGGEGKRNPADLSLLKRCPCPLSEAKAFPVHLYMFSGRALFHLAISRNRGHEGRLILIQVFAYR